MVQGLLERLLNAKQMDAWFENVGEVQYTKKILFSSLVALMLEVVCRVRKTVHSAYLNSNIDASRQAVYDKLKNTEVNTSRGIVRYIGSEAGLIIREMKGTQAPLLPGFRLKFLDGNCIEATEHRLKVLRDTKAGALPGKSLVVFEQESGIVTDVFPCEDGHAQERSLLSSVLETVQEGDLWCADRNFCTLGFMFGIHKKNACFIFRQHANTPFKPLSDKVFIGESESGKVYEQRVGLRFEEEEIEIRRIIVVLKKPTRNGDKELVLFTNLKEEHADALKISFIYSKRWTIETAFQKVEKYLNSEINSLAYPKAALFGFCMALVAFNIYAVVMSAIQAAYPEKSLNDEVSDYYIAEEISATFNGMNMILEEEDWMYFISCSIIEFSQLMVALAKNIELRKFKKHKRGPKKPPPLKNKYKGKPHVSTARLLS
ncbi:MAG: transposase [Bacteroidota bacterium]